MDFDSSASSPSPPDCAKADLREDLTAQRRNSIAQLGQLVVQRSRVEAALKEIDTKIAAHRRDVDAIDLVLGSG